MVQCTSFVKAFFGFMALFFTVSVAAEHGQSNAIMQHAKVVLNEARELENESSLIFKRSNELLKEIKKLRVKQRNRQNDAASEEFAAMIDLLNTQREHWQQQGTLLRQRSATLEQQALLLMRQGFTQVWQEKVRLHGPMQLQSSHHEVMAHNAPVRSVHPSMHGRMTDGAETQQQHNMTMKVPALSGQNAPADLDVSTFQRSRNLHYFAHVEPLTEPNLAVPLNEIHQWRLLVSDSDGRPLANANVSIDGHMPGHVHGLPTQPRITRELSPGEYLVQGVKFQMTGWWVMQFDIEHNDTQDSLVFNLVL